MLEAPITAVTVFRDGARVQRSGTVSMTQGTQAVVIGGLPASVDPASVRVAARGPGLTLLTVEVHHGYRTDPLRDETARLRAEAERCRDAVRALDDEDAAVQARLDFLGHLSGAAATALARAVGFGRASHDELAQMAGHLSADTGDALGRRRDIAARSRAARRELEAAERRLNEAEQRAGQPAAYTDVSAILEADAPAQGTEAEVELSYHVPGASWRPLYDLTLDGEQLAVSYLAEVIQQTGEDWPAVELVLATTRSGRYQGLPELDPWYIGKAPAPPPAVPRMTHRAMAFTARSPRAAAEQAGGQADQPEAAVLMAEPSDAVGAGLVYRVQRPLAVPADGGPHKTSIGRFGLDAALDHLAVPALAAEAYLRATVTNTSPLLLLPGPARVFHGPQFVGETSLPTVAAGEEFELQLGVDDQIRVERTLRRRGTGKAVIGGTRTIDIGYEITVENHRTGKTRVSVHDRIPVSTDADIKVRLRETNPAPAKQTDLGELTWELALDGGQEATVRYRFTVEHPAQVTVSGL